MTYILPELAGLTPDDFAYDYSQRVPFSSLAAMVIALILAVAVPVFFFVYLKRRYKLEPLTIIHGLLAYMVGGYLIPYFCYIGLQYIDSSTGFFTANDWLYSILMSVITAGLEFAALYLGLKLVKKKQTLNIGNAVFFAVVFCLFPLLTETVSNLGNFLSVSITVNQGGLYDAIASMIASEAAREDIEALLLAMDSLFSESFFYYIFMTLDVLLLLFARIGVCILIAAALLHKIQKPQSYFAIGIEVLYAFAMFLRYCGAIQGYVAAELIYLVLAVISLILALRVLNQFMPEDKAKLFGKPDPALSAKNKDDKNNKNGSSGHKMPKIVMPKD